MNAILFQWYFNINNNNIYKNDNNYYIINLKKSEIITIFNYKSMIVHKKNIEKIIELEDYLKYQEKGLSIK